MRPTNPLLLCLVLAVLPGVSFGKPQKLPCRNESKDRVLVICDCPLEGVSGLGARLTDGNQMSVKGLVAIEDQAALQEKFCNDVNPFNNLENLVFLPKNSQNFRDPVRHKNTQNNFSKLSKPKSKELETFLSALQSISADKRCASLQITGVRITPSDDHKSGKKKIEKGVFELDNTLATQGVLDNQNIGATLLNPEGKEIKLTWTFCDKKLSVEKILFGPAKCGNSLYHQALDGGYCRALKPNTAVNHKPGNADPVE